MKYFLAILFAVAILLNAEAQTTHAQSDELLNEGR
jgi:hypothetical protein